MITYDGHASGNNFLSSNASVFCTECTSGNIIVYSNIYAVHPGRTVRLSTNCDLRPRVLRIYYTGPRFLRTFTSVKEDFVRSMSEKLSETHSCRYRPRGYQWARKNDNSISNDVHYKRYIYYVIS